MRRQLFADQVVEQETGLRFVGVGRERPGASRLSNGIPGPDRARLDGLGVARDAAYLAPLRLDPDPVAIGDLVDARGVGIDEQDVVRMNLSQPGVLRIPRVLHRHRSLGYGRERVLLLVGDLGFERFVVKGQGVEVCFDALSEPVRRLP